MKLRIYKSAVYRSLGGNYCPAGTTVFKARGYSPSWIIEPVIHWHPDGWRLYKIRRFWRKRLIKRGIR